MTTSERRPTTPRLAAAALLLCAFSACAVVQTPVSMSPLTATAATVPSTLGKDLHIDFGTGYSRDIKAGSQWEPIGSVPQGQVFKPYKQVFTLEGAHMHEAYLVVSNGRLVGFYLPAEGGFSSLKQTLAISLY